MSLFKILHGKLERLSKQEKHDGWAWYTHDDGGFYVDSTDDNGENLERKRVNDAATTALDSKNFDSKYVKGALDEIPEKYAPKSHTHEVEIEYDAKTKTITFNT